MTIRAIIIKKEEIVFEAENTHDARRKADELCPEGCEIDWHIVKEDDMITDYENPYL